MLINEESNRDHVFITWKLMICFKCHFQIAYFDIDKICSFMKWWASWASSLHKGVNAPRYYVRVRSDCRHLFSIEESESNREKCSECIFWYSVCIYLGHLGISYFFFFLCVLCHFIYNILTAETDHSRGEGHMG